MEDIEWRGFDNSTGRKKAGYLQRGPEPVELCALVDVDDAVLGRLAVPHGVVEEALDAVEDHLEDGEATAQPLARQQVALARDLGLLRVPEDGHIDLQKFSKIFHNLRYISFALPDFVDILHDLQRRVLGLQPLLLRLWLLALCKSQQTSAQHISQRWRINASLYLCKTASARCSGRGLRGEGP